MPAHRARRRTRAPPGLGSQKPRSPHDDDCHDSLHLAPGATPFVEKQAPGLRAPTRPLRTSSRSAGDRCSSTKAAVSAPRADPPLTAELDDQEQCGASCATALSYRGVAVGKTRTDASCRWESPITFPSRAPGRRRIAALAPGSRSPVGGFHTAEPFPTATGRRGSRCQGASSSSFASVQGRPVGVADRGERDASNRLGQVAGSATAADAESSLLARRVCKAAFIGPEACADPSAFEPTSWRAGGGGETPAGRGESARRQAGLRSSPGTWCRSSTLRSSVSVLGGGSDLAAVDSRRP
jgi:hypothetical protein